MYSEVMLTDVLLEDLQIVCGQSTKPSGLSLAGVYQITANLELFIPFFKVK